MAQPLTAIMEGVIRTRTLREEDLPWKRAWLLRAWGGTSVARKGELVDVLDLAFYRDGVARSRLAKASIPLVNGDGVPVRHELEFELLLAHRR